MMVSLTHVVQTLCLLATLTLPWVSGVPASAQQPIAPAAQQPPKRPVLVVMPDSFPRQDAKFLVVRYADPSKNEVIILQRENATPDVLAAAVRLIWQLRRTGPKLETDEVNGITSLTRRSGFDPRLLEPPAAKLKELLGQPRSRIGNLGHGVGDLGMGRQIELADASFNP